jgi:hypothetical protein
MKPIGLRAQRTDANSSSRRLDRLVGRTEWRAEIDERRIESAAPLSNDVENRIGMRCLHTLHSTQSLSQNQAFSSTSKAPFEGRGMTKGFSSDGRSTSWRRQGAQLPLVSVEALVAASSA